MATPKKLATKKVVPVRNKPVKPQTGKSKLKTAKDYANPRDVSFYTSAPLKDKE